MRQDFPLSTLFRAARMPLCAAAQSVPPGRWGIAVSGGADSVATLRLLSRRGQARGDLELIVIHLDHQLRGAESEADARFVQELASELGLIVHFRRREEVEARFSSPSKRRGILDAPRDCPGAGDTEQAGAKRPVRIQSAYLRDLRLSLFGEAVTAHGLQGVILGHHADDVAETLFMRLLRNSPRSGTLGLAPLRFEQIVGGVRLLRPMLRVRRRRLRHFLERTHCPWREDASNATATQLRNRVRLLLAETPEVSLALLGLAERTALVEEALDAATPRLETSPRLEDLAPLATPLLRRALRRWMVAQGVPDAAAGPRAVDGLLGMLDAAGPAGLDLAGGIRVHRRRGRLFASRGSREGGR